MWFLLAGYYLTNMIKEYDYERNRQREREESIIELLKEIRDKLP